MQSDLHANSAKAHLGFEILRPVGSLLVPDIDKGNWVAWSGKPLAASAGTSPGLGVESDGLASIITWTDSFSLPKAETTDAEPTDGAFEFVENAEYCDWPWDPDLTRPSLLAMWRALPMAAAAAKCWKIRSSSSASLRTTGSCNEKFRKK